MTSPDPQQLMALFESGRFRDVVQMAQTAAIDPRSEPLLAQVHAASLFKLGLYSESLPILDELYSPLCHDPDYLNLLASTCRRLGMLDRARTVFAEALKLSVSPAIRNNYANLLVDLGQYQEAKQILELLVSDNPAYNDAVSNLNRLEFLLSKPVARSEGSSLAGGTVVQSRDQSWQPLDPLMLAFSDEEINLPAKSKSAFASKLPEPKNLQLASEQLQQAQRAVRENNPEFALSLCSQIRFTLPSNESVYVHASDAYIRLRRFHEAEICALTAVALGLANFNIYANLVTFTCMRGDDILANQYLEKAASLDPSNTVLARLRQQVESVRNDNAQKPYRFSLHWNLPQVDAIPQP